MEFQSNLYIINTTTGAATVGTTDSNDYLSSIPLFEDGTYYAGTGSGFGTINVTTGQITPGSALSGGPGSTVGLAPDPLPAGTPPVMLTANAYMLATQAQGNQNPFGIVDLNSGAFTLIGNMGSGGYDGLAVANGALYTEQNGLLYSVNTANANLTLVGGVTAPNLAAFGSTTSGLYGLAGTGPNVVATLMSINPQTGAITAIGPIGASAIPNGQGAYVSLSVGSSTLYMEFQGNLYTVNTANRRGHAVVGTTDSHGYLTSVPLLEYGTYYVASDSVIGTINVTTGQIDPHSSIFGPAGSPVALAPDPLTTAAPVITLVANAEGGAATIAPNSWVEIKGSNLAPAGMRASGRARIL